MYSYLHTTIRHYFQKRAPSIQRGEEQVASQQQLLLHLIHTAQNTQWGQLHHYPQIKQLSTYQQAVPLQDYESLYPYIQLMQQGAKDILWPGFIKWFAKSSGTTSQRSKFIPVSDVALKEGHYKGARDTMTLYAQAIPNTSIFKGKSLIIGGSSNVSSLHPQIQAGDISSILLLNIPWLGHILRTPSPKIALMADWEAKLNLIAQQTIHQNITQLAGVPTWYLVLFRKILQLTKAQHILEVWPNLELYIHGGVSFTPYQQEFQQLLPSPTVQYWQSYNASEGFFAIQDEAGRDDMLLLSNHGIYYEFIPLHELQKETPRALSLDQVATNTTYALVITTNSGLWRYLIGDTIRFTTLAPYRIQVVGRTKHFINAFGEEVMVANSDQAIAYACQQTAANVQEYTVAPVYISSNNSGCHEWLIEFTQLPTALEDFKQALDEGLQAVNSDYAAKRSQNLALRAPIIKVAPPNTFYKWLKAKNKLGGQHKIPRLSNNRLFLEEIMSYTNR